MEVREHRLHRFHEMGVEMRQVRVIHGACRGGIASRQRLLSRLFARVWENLRGLRTPEPRGQATGYATSTGNEVTNDGVYTYTYDNNGNLVQQSKGTGLETWYYS